MTLPSKFLRGASVSLHGNISPDRPLSGRPMAGAVLQAVAEGRDVQAVLTAMPVPPAKARALSRWSGAEHVSMFDPAGHRVSYNMAHRAGDASSQKARAEFLRRADMMVAFGGQSASPLSDAGLCSQILVTQFEGPLPRVEPASRMARPSDVHERAQKIVRHQSRMSL